MSKMMSVSSIVVLFLAALSHAEVLHVKHVPSYVVLQQQEPDASIKSSSLPNLISGPLGIEKQNPVMRSKSVLKRPAANVLFTLITQEGHDVPMESIAKFPMEMDLPFIDVEQLMNNVQRKFVDKEPVMFDMNSDSQLFDVSSTSSLFSSLPTSLNTIKDRFATEDSVLNTVLPKMLNTSINSDCGLMAELQMVQDVIKTLKVSRDSLNTKTPDLLSFTLTGMKAVADEHGLGSDQVKEAEQIVGKHINEMTNELKAIYGGNVMVEVVISPSQGHGLVRKTRSLKGSDDPPVKPDTIRYNLAYDWYPDFPASFNIVLFLMIVLILTVIFIAYGIWNMNPNLESILYRVPQDEQKKTN